MFLHLILVQKNGVTTTHPAKPNNFRFSVLQLQVQNFAGLEDVGWFIIKVGLIISLLFFIMVHRATDQPGFLLVRLMQSTANIFIYICVFSTFNNSSYSQTN